MILEAFLKRKIMLFSLALILITLPILYLVYKYKPKAEAAWWNETWLYRRVVNITNSSGSNLTDFQVSFNLDTASLISSGKMQSDCDDIRITDVSGNILPHWIEENNPGCNNSATKIWTKVPSLPTSGATVYVYYGNSSATNTENGDQVFQFFDGFNGSSLNTGKWTIISQDYISVSGGYLEIDRTSSSTSIAASYSPLSESVIEFKGIQIMESPSFRNRLYFGTLSGTTFTTSTLDDGVAGGNKDYGLFYDGANAPTEIYLDTWRNVMLNTSDTFSIKFVLRGSVVDAYYRNRTTDTQIYSLTGLTPSIVNSSINAVSLQVTEQNSSHFKIDHVFVRKYASTDPSSSLSSEEQSHGPIAYWKFDEGTGTTTYDSTANKNNGTISGATWQTEDMCVVGKCLYFDGTDDVVTISNSVGNIKTVSFWVKPITTSEQFIDLNGSAYIQASSGTISATGFSSPTIYVNGKISSTIEANKWQHVVVTTNTTVSGSAIKIARISSNYGQVFADEVKLYPYARTAAQVLADYNAGKAKAASSKGVAVNLGAPKDASAGLPSSLSEGLVGYWKMDESSWTNDCSTSTVIDYSGNGNHGKSCPSGAGSQPTTGKFGNAGNFDGSNDYVNLGNNSTLNFGNSSSYSIQFWLKKSGSFKNYDEILSKNQTGDSRIHFLIDSNGVLYRWGDSYKFTGPTLSLNQWSHIVYTYSADGNNTGTEKFYVNGQSTNSRTGSMPEWKSSDDFWLGYHAYMGGSWPLQGLIDEVRIYNRALSPVEVRALYEWAPRPVGYWKIEEGSGSNVYDSSGNSRTGTIVNGIWSTGKFGKGLKLDGTGDYLEITDF